MQESLFPPGLTLVLMGFVAVTCLFGSGCTHSDSLPPAAPDHPLPDCPDTPNCERSSQAYPVSPDRLYAGAQRALTALGPAQLHLQPDSMRASAVYRVAWIFKDDVSVAIEAQSDSSVLHVRSASRVGESDLGVNRRRVLRFFEALEEELSAHPSAAK